MSAPVPYFNVICNMPNAFDYRLRLATHAHQHGIKATARAFSTTVPTVRKWLRRYRNQGLKGLQEHSRAPRHQPHQTAVEVEQQVVELRRQLPTFGSRRLIHEFDLPLSHGALERIWRAHGLIHRRRKKYQRKQDLPAVQYTAREVRSGLQFLAFSSRRSASACFAARIQAHLARCGVELRHLAWQTDNGGEFVGSLQKDGTRSGFPAALGDSPHQRISPAAHTFQSDVETVHRLIEDEFYDLETFTSRFQFLAKATLYQHYFNLARPNSHKGGLSPWQIIQQLEPRRPLDLCLLPPVFLDYCLNDQGGYDLPRHPYNWQN